MQCSRCKGHGVLITEATNPQHVTRQCPECMGNGYVPRIDVPATQPQVTAPDYFPPAQPNVAAAAPPPEIPPMPQYDPTTNQWLDPATGQPIGTAGGGNHSTAALAGGSQ